MKHGCFRFLTFYNNLNIAKLDTLILHHVLGQVIWQVGVAPPLNQVHTLIVVHLQQRLSVNVSEQLATCQVAQPLQLLQSAYVLVEGFFCRSP